MYGLHREDGHDGDRVNYWRVIGGIIKYFRLSWEEIVWGRSFANIIMLLESIPPLKDDKEIEGPEDLKGLI